jgi:hypothetical protein
VRPVAFGVLGVGPGSGRIIVGHRIDQELCREPRTIALVAQRQRRGCGEIAAGAVAGDGESVGTSAEFRGVNRRPAGRKHAIVEGGRELVLRCETIIDGDDDAFGARAQIRHMPSWVSRLHSTKPLP